MVSSLTSTNEVAQKFLYQDPIILENIVKQLTTPKVDSKIQQYASEILDASKEAGIDIAQQSYSLRDYQIATQDARTTFTKQPSAVSYSYDFSGFQKTLEQDKQKAKEIIDNVVAMARATKQEFMKELMDRPIHPYEQMIHDYLGRNFKPKSVEEMVVEEDLNPLLVLAEITELSKKLQEKAMLQVRQIVSQAMNTSFPGITSDALGTAFAKLSGEEFQIDDEMTKRHLEFVENIRAISVDYVVSHPYEAAKKILSEFKRCKYSF